MVSLRSYSTKLGYFFVFTLGKSGFTGSNRTVAQLIGDPRYTNGLATLSEECERRNIH